MIVEYIRRRKSGRLYDNMWSQLACLMGRGRMGNKDICSMISISYRLSLNTILRSTYFTRSKTILVMEQNYTSRSPVFTYLFYFNNIMDTYGSWWNPKFWFSFYNGESWSVDCSLSFPCELYKDMPCSHCVSAPSTVSKLISVEGINVLLLALTDKFAAKLWSLLS